MGKHKTPWVVSPDRSNRNEELGKPMGAPTKPSLPGPSKREQLGLGSLCPHDLENIFLTREWFGLFFQLFQLLLTVI